jgi:hypothetical protein
MAKMSKQELLAFRRVVEDICEDPTDPVGYDATILRIIDQLLATMD